MIKIDNKDIISFIKAVDSIASNITQLSNTIPRGDLSYEELNAERNYIKERANSIRDSIEVFNKEINGDNIEYISVRKMLQSIYSIAMDFDLYSTFATSLCYKIENDPYDGCEYEVLDNNRTNDRCSVKDYVKSCSDNLLKAIEELKQKLNKSL